MEQQEAQAALERLLAQEPKREDFLSEEAFQDAMAGFKHRAGPSLRTLRSLANPGSSRSPATAR